MDERRVLADEQKVSEEGKRKGGTLICFSLAVAFVTNAHIVRLRHSHSHTLHSIMVESKGERVRLYVRGTILGYKRSKSNQYPSTSLLQIEGVNTPEEVNWYLGKRIAYVYKAKTKKNGSLHRCIWGKVARSHGNSGIVRSRFRSNLPPASLGGRVRVFMYPSQV